MKKFFNLFVVAIAAIAMVSCGEQPEPKVFSFKVENVTATTATVTVTPNKDDVTYYFDLYTAEDFKASTPAEICAEMNSYLQEYLDYYVQNGYKKDELLANLLSVGKDTWDYEDLAPETKYVVVSFLWDAATETFTSLEVSEEFATSKVEKIDFSFTLQEAEDRYNVIPSNATVSYFFDFVDKDSIDGANPSEYFVEEVDYIKELTDLYGASMGIYFSDFLYQGNIYFEKDDLEEGHSYYVMAAAFVGSVMCSDVHVVSIDNFHNENGNVEEPEVTAAPAKHALKKAPVAKLAKKVNRLF